MVCHSDRAVNACAVLYRLDVGIVSSRTIRGMNAFFSVFCPVCVCGRGVAPFHRTKNQPNAYKPELETYEV